MIGRTFGIDCSYVNGEGFDWLFAQAQPTHTLQVWPYGKRWFLPRWDLTDAQIGGIESRPEETKVDWTAQGCLKIEDCRIHARFLRWWWIKVRGPVRRLFTRQREDE